MTTLQPFGENIWIADGPVVSFYGVPFPTRMAVVRLEHGGLWLWSPIRLDDELKREITNLGEPTVAVEPNKLHHLALAEWVAAWPALKLHAPPGLARKRPDLKFAAELGPEAPSEWRDDIEQLPIEGSVVLTEFFFFHRRSRTCLIGDLVQHHTDGGKSWKRWLIRVGGVGGPDGSTPLDARLSFWHRRRTRASVERALAWRPERLIVAHGPCVLEDAEGSLRRAMAWVLD